MIEATNQEKIERLIKDQKMALLLFGNEVCGVCKVMKPKLKQLLLEYPQIKGVYVAADQYLDLAASYNIFTLPAILVFAEGKEIIREARHISLHELEIRISRYYQMMFT